MSFAPGDRVRLSESWLARPRSGADRQRAWRGLVVGMNTNGFVRVRWTGRTDTAVYDPGYLVKL